MKPILLVGEDVLVEQVGAEHGRVVGVERDHQAGVEVAAQRMGGVAGAAAGADVGGHVDLDGDLAFGEDLHQFFVVLGGEAVADAFGADVDGGPDGGGAVDGATGFSGVGGEAEAGGFGFGVEGFEKRGGAAGFVAADADADDGGILGAEFRGFAEDAGGLVGAEVSDGVDEPEEGGAGFGFGAEAAALDGLHVGLNLDLVPVIKDAEGDVDLGMHHTLRGEGADHVVGDQLVVFGGAEAGGHGFVGFHEALEVLVGVEGAGLDEGERGGVVALAEGDQGFGVGGPLEVEVQLDLGQAAEPGGDIDRVAGWGGGGISAGHHLLNRLRQNGGRRRVDCKTLQCHGGVTG